MNIQRRIGAILFAAILFGSLPVAAETSSATMQVSMQVIARAVVSIESQPAAIDITATDIARGYVDVAAPIVVRVRTNSRRGYILQAEKVNEAFASIELSMPDASMNIASHESWIQRPYLAGGDVMPIHARLRLAPGATQGSHALPVAFNASPL